MLTHYTPSVPIIFMPPFCSASPSRKAPELRTSLERQRKLQVVLFEEGLVREDLRRRTVRHHRAPSDHDAPFADIKDQVEVVGGNDLGMFEGLEQRNQRSPRPRVQVCGG